MKILIIGDGKVGYALAEQLSGEEHDVTIIDNNMQALTKAVEKLDVLCIRGSGSSMATLKDAGIKKQDVVLIATSSDELNMVCSMLANNLSDARIITRIRNPEYEESELFIKDVLGIDMCINPELLAADDIARLFRFPQAYSMESFFRGKVEMIEFGMAEDSPILGKPLMDIMPKLPNRVIISAVYRDESLFIADGSTVLQKDDHIFVLGEPSQQAAFARHLMPAKQKIKDVIIVGGSRICYYLASQVQKAGMRVRIIEQNPERCTQLYEMLPEATIIQGDGTDQDLLLEEHLEDMDAFVALTDRDEENIIAGLYALEKGVRKIVAKVTRPYYARLTQDIATISPKDLVANRIVRYVRSIANSQGSFVERLYYIMRGYAQAMEFVVSESAFLIGIPLKELRFKRGILVVAIMHKGKVSIPSGSAVIQKGDHVMIITNEEYFFTDINEILVGV